MKRLASALSLLALLGLLACPAAIAIAPPAIDFGACVAKEAIGGKALEQIVVDCGGDLVSVISAIFQATEPTIPTTKAYGEALAIRRVMLAVDAGTK
jgi:hypothetical protein